MESKLAAVCRWFIVLGLLVVSTTVDRSAAGQEEERASNEVNAPPQQRRWRGFGMPGIYRARIEPNWFAGNSKFWYRNNLRDGNKEFVVVDVESGTRKPAFDHGKLATSLSKAADESYEADELPFNRIEFTDDDKSLRFVVGNAEWGCKLDSYECAKVGDAPDENDEEESDDGESGRGRRRFGRGGEGRRFGRGGPSPDGKWVAFIRDNNVFIRAAKNEEEEDGDNDDENAEEIQLSKDGTNNVGYGLLQWAPDSKTLVAFRVQPGDRKEVYLVETSPRGGGRAKLRTRPYDLPGDKLTSYELNLFNVAEKKQTKPDVDKVDLGFPRLMWDDDDRHFAYEKADRGHQRFRVIRVDSHTGDARNIIDEKTETFIWTAHAENLDLEMVNWLPDTDEIVYVSERDGWRHMYLVDVEKGEIKNQITEGEYVIRGIDRIDEEKRQIWFRASGKNPDQDPYFIHYYRVNFDGSDLTALTEGDGNHSVQFSPDRKYLIDTYSSVDMPPKHELRRASDGKLVCPLDEADASELIERSDYHPLEAFVAKGRDGKTDIWGVICRPRDFDPDKKYPVIESIYAGPQGSFVPKSFGGGNRYASLADLGFIVVQIDGMGTANRSKAFHDVCWHNIKDAGFPDRILWMKAAAEKYPYMDLSRVGIYGGSAGGQNAAAGVLFHPEFYKAAVAGCGCHDNRMDKASWNEQWMGYPVGPQYAECSNIDNAARLQGKLMLIVGELDDNVPTESTFRFVDALIKAEKDFDLIVVPGAGHGMGGEYGMRRLQDFFVGHLRGTDLPDRNSPEAARIADARRERGERRGRGADAGRGSAEERRTPLDLSSLPSQDRIARIVDRFRDDRSNLRRYYRVQQSPHTQVRFRKFYIDWLTAIATLPTDSLSGSDRKAYDDLKNEIVDAIAHLEQHAQRRAKIEQLVPFGATIVRLAEDRQEIRKVNAQQAAELVDKLSRQIEECHSLLEASLKSKSASELELSSEDRKFAAQTIGELRAYLRNWYRFYDGYDPLFTWWLRAPYRQADEAMEEYAALLAGPSDGAKGASPAASPNVEVDASAAATNASPPESDVPDLAALIEEKPSRLEPIIAKFRSDSSAWRGRRGGRDQFDGTREFSDDSTREDGDRRSRTTRESTPKRDDDDEDEAQEDRQDLNRNRRAVANRTRRMREDTPAARQRSKARLDEWLSALDKLDFDGFSLADRVDYLLLKNHINYRQRRLEMADISDDNDRPAAMDRSGIRGRPIGREALRVELDHEMIAYTPDQLLQIAERENAWCEAELTKAALEMGLGDDWQQAVEKIKTMHVPPGEQPYLIHELAIEAIDYLKEHELVTVPPLAAETWGLQMMSPRRQLINPFFTGGNTISVSFPTDTMSHEEKLQSMRGNNTPFARATVHHELIPGHNLQFFMTARYHPYRRIFSTPFWGEGWALYWEMLLYDRDFAKTPEDRVGFLVWRKHRCARIIFSLNFHLGRMTPQECIDFLVANVGFDRHNAAAEVRRSFQTAEPLYQAAYMLGGLQIRELRKELVDSGKMTDREFHDAILKEGSMPIVMVRALLTDQPLTKNYEPKWLFYGPLSEDQPVAGPAP